MVEVRIADAGAAADEIHARCEGGPGWFVGTASDPRHNLQAFHGVDLATGRYAILRCTNAGVALAAARLLREEHGYQGVGTGGPGCEYVYAFAAVPGTRGVR